MRIIVDRSSVCMGDDVVGHRKTFEIDEHFDVIELFRYLINASFFPRIYGNDVVWIMIFNKKEIASYQTKRNKIISTLFTIPKVKDLISNGEQLFYFFYYTTREARAEHIFKKSNGDEHLILSSELSNEYQSYTIKKRLREKWIEEIRER